MVRCFEDGNIIHVAGRVSPADDMDVINLELALADLSQVLARNFEFSFLFHCVSLIDHDLQIERRLERLKKGAKDPALKKKNDGVCHAIRLILDQRKHHTCTSRSTSFLAKLPFIC